MFWKDLKNEKLYDSKDLYGNKDLFPAQKAEKAIEKAIDLISPLPYPYKEFYALRMVEKLKESCLKWSAAFSVLFRI